MLTWTRCHQTALNQRLEADLLVFGKKEIQTLIMLQGLWVVTIKAYWLLVSHL